MPQPVAICCHDAGAANLIAAWAADDAPAGTRLCAAGPAIGVFGRVTPDREPLALDAALDGAATVLSGSGWGSDLEHESRVRARERGIASVAVLDHWVNYRPRFSRGGAEQLPDAFIVTDAEASILAAAEFGRERPILEWPNTYLEREAARVRSLARSQDGGALRVLIVLEPIREPGWGQQAQLPELQALDYLVRNIDTWRSASHGVELRLRPHPSESADKYAGWAALQKAHRTEFSTGGALADDIAWADVVAGLQSYALIVALAAGRRAVSYLPPSAPACALRHPALEHLRECVGAFA